MRRRLLDHTYKRTVTGNPAVAKSVARMYPDISFPGKTEQQQTTGAQLVDKIIIGNAIQSANGNVICSVEENGIRIKTKEGVDTTSNSDIYFYGNQNSNSESAYDECLKQGTYTIYAGNSNKNFTLYVVAWRNNLSVILSSTINSISTFSVLEGDKLRIFIRPNTSEIVDVLMPYIINEGSTSKSYELYTGGKPSPSPEYKQKIVNTQSPVQVEVMGGNLFDLSYALNPSNYNEIYISEIKYNALVYHVKPNTDYILSVEWKKEKPSVNLCIANDERRSSLFAEGYMSRSVNSLDNGIIYVLYAGRLLDDNISELTLNYDGIMLTEGSAKIPYEPYKQPQTVTITSDRLITQWDKLVKQNGVWGWLYKSNEEVFDGSEDETWGTYSAQNGYNILIGDMKKGSKQDGYCDKLINDMEKIVPEKSCWFGSGNNYFYALKVQEYASDKNEWKTWLQSNPIKVLYETENTEFVPLTEEEQQAMNTLYTFSPTTVVQNSIGTEITLDYKTKRSLEVTT